MLNFHRKKEKKFLTLVLFGEPPYSPLRMIYQHTSGGDRMQPFAELDGHVHEYRLPTTTVDHHRHCMLGLTGPALPCFGGHFHYFAGETTFQDGHIHYYRGFTGPAVATGRSHVHSLGGLTSFNDLHDHAYAGSTGSPRQLRQL